MKVVTVVAKRRLTKLADFLAGLPDKRFDLNKWGYTPNIDSEEFHPEEGPVDFNEVTHKCGTTACAMGWAASMPEFRKEGLRLEVRSSTSWLDGEDIGAWSINYYKRDRVNGGRDLNSEGFEAAARFMHITHSQSEYLFGPDSYYEDAMDRKNVIKRIRDFVRYDGRNYLRYLKDHYLDDEELGIYQDGVNFE